MAIHLFDRLLAEVKKDLEDWLSSPWAAGYSTLNCSTTDYGSLNTVQKHFLD